MMYGTMAEKDVKLSSIVRALKEKITPKKVEDRLSRMLSSSELETSLFLSRRAARGAFAQQKSLEGVSPEREARVAVGDALAGVRRSRRAIF
jgi:hypothetical protein